MTASPDNPTQATQSASDLLLAASTARDTETMTIGELLETLQDRAFGLVMLLFALPVCLPFVYGLPQIVSIPMALIAVQIVAGRHTLWLPDGVKHRSFSRATFADVARRSQKYIKWFEALARPRLSFLTRNGPERFFGLLMVIFCISIAIPLPGTNTTPGIAIAIMSIGFIERDGVLVIVGSILGALWVTLLAIFGAVFLAWLSAMASEFFTWILQLFQSAG